MSIFSFGFSTRDRSETYRNEPGAVSVDVVPPAPLADERAFLVAFERQHGSEWNFVGQGREREYGPRPRPGLARRLRGAFPLLFPFDFAQGELPLWRTASAPRIAAREPPTAYDECRSALPAPEQRFLCKLPRLSPSTPNHAKPRQSNRTIHRRTSWLIAALRRTIWTARFVSKKWTFPISTSNPVPAATKSVLHTLDRYYDS